MLDRYSAEARGAVELARDEAARLGHPYIGTEHLLLGLLAEGDNAAARALNGAGASLALCREKVTEALASRSGRPSGIEAEDLELTDRAARALDRAAKLSARLKCDHVEPVHVLRSVLDVEGTAGQVLRGLSVDLGSVRDGIKETSPDLAAADRPVPAAGDEPASESEAGAPAPNNSSGPTGAPTFDPLCPACGVQLQGSLGRSVVTALDGTDFDVSYCAACGTTLGLTRGATTTGRSPAAGRAAGNGPSRDPGPPRPRRRRA